jgi:NADPH:quinone reductase-like Zn-dependent oxidoreductase
MFWFRPLLSTSLRHREGCRAVRAGPPESFRIEDIPTPTAGCGQAVIRVEACRVSSRDIVERNGTYKRDVEFPLVMALEIAGTVIAVGSGVHAAAEDDRVCTKAFASCGNRRVCRNGREATCLARRPVRGGYAEFAAIDADVLIPLPPGLSFVQACSAGPAAGVALNAVRDVARVRIGETVLITGASGGVGSAALQIAQACGARVIAATRNPKKTPALRDDGAHEVVTHGPTMVAQVRELTHDLGVDVVIVAVGSAVFADCFDSLAVHGRYAFVGELHGGTVPINPARIFFKRAQLLGVGSVSRSQVDDALELMEAGRLRIRSAAVLPLDAIARAHQLVECSELTGRVVVSSLLEATEGDQQ